MPKNMQSLGYRGGAFFGVDHSLAGFRDKRNREARDEDLLANIKVRNKYFAQVAAMDESVVEPPLKLQTMVADVSMRIQKVLDQVTAVQASIDTSPVTVGFGATGTDKIDLSAISERWNELVRAINPYLTGPNSQLLSDEDSNQIKQMITNQLQAPIQKLKVSISSRQGSPANVINYEVLLGEGMKSIENQIEDKYYLPVSYGPQRSGINMSLQAAPSSGGPPQPPPAPPGTPPAPPGTPQQVIPSAPAAPLSQEQLRQARLSAIEQRRLQQLEEQEGPQPQAPPQPQPQPQQEQQEEQEQEGPPPRTRQELISRLNAVVSEQKKESLKAENFTRMIADDLQPLLSGVSEKKRKQILNKAKIDLFPKLRALTGKLFGRLDTEIKDYVEKNPETDNPREDMSNFNDFYQRTLQTNLRANEPVIKKLIADFIRDEREGKRQEQELPSTSSFIEPKKPTSSRTKLPVAETEGDVEPDERGFMSFSPSPAQRESSAQFPGPRYRPVTPSPASLRDELFMKDFLKRMERRRTGEPPTPQQTPDPIGDFTERVKRLAELSTARTGKTAPSTAKSKNPFLDTETRQLMGEVSAPKGEPPKDRPPRRSQAIEPKNLSESIAQLSPVTKATQEAVSDLRAQRDAIQFKMDADGNLSSIETLRRLPLDERKRVLNDESVTGLTVKDIKELLAKYDPNKEVKLEGKKKENFLDGLAEAVSPRKGRSPSSASVAGPAEEPKESASARLIPILENNIRQIKENMERHQRENNRELYERNKAALESKQRQLDSAKKQAGQSGRGRGKTDYTGPMDEPQTPRPKRTNSAQRVTRPRGGKKNLPQESYEGFNDEGNDLFTMPAPMQGRTELMSTENAHMPILTGNKGLPKIYGMEKKLKMAGFYKPQMHKPIGYF